MYNASSKWHFISCYMIIFIIFTDNSPLLLTQTLVLLLEPDNKTCSEFHAVIAEKMLQGLYA